jgi:hypothetical protein
MLRGELISTRASLNCSNTQPCPCHYSPLTPLGPRYPGVEYEKERQMTSLSCRPVGALA